MFIRNSKGFNMYDKCICGSDKKLKFCCYSEARSRKREIAQEGMRKIYDDNRLNHEHDRAWKKADFKTCFMNNKDCCGDIKGAHSIQNNKILNMISKDGHLYMISNKFVNSVPEAYFKKISRNKASKFYGFCDFHDSKIFSPIEKFNYENTLEQNLLFAYRANSLELHRKIQLLNNRKIKFIQNKELLFNTNFEMEYNQALLDVLDFEREQNTLKQYIQNKNFSTLETIHIKLDYQVSFAASSSFAIKNDIEGKVLVDAYNYDEDYQIPSIYLSIFPYESGTHIILSYDKKDTVYESFFDKCREYSIDKMINFLNYLLIESTENIFFSFSFIESLTKLQKDSLLLSFESLIYPLLQYDLLRHGQYFNFNLFTHNNN